MTGPRTGIFSLPPNFKYVTEHSPAPLSVPLLHATHTRVHLCPAGQGQEGGVLGKPPVSLLLSLPPQYPHMSESVGGTPSQRHRWKSTRLPGASVRMPRVLPEGGALAWVHCGPPGMAPRLFHRET